MTRPCIRNLMRALSSPWALVLLPLALCVNAYLQPHELYRHSRVGVLIHGMLVRPSTRGITVFVVKTPSGSWQEAADEVRAATPNCPCVTFIGTEWADGWWSVNHVEIVEQVWFEGDASFDDRLAMVAAVRLSNPDILSTQTTETYASGGSTTTRILWLGVLNDLFVLFLFIALGCSLVLNVKRIRRERRRRNLIRNICPSCGYSLENLRGPICPECGKPLVE